MDIQKQLKNLTNTKTNLLNLKRTYESERQEGKPESQLIHLKNLIVKLEKQVQDLETFALTGNAPTNNFMTKKVPENKFPNRPTIGVPPPPPQLSKKDILSNKNKQKPKFESRAKKGKVINDDDDEEEEKELEKFLKDEKKKS